MIQTQLQNKQNQTLKTAKEGKTDSGLAQDTNLFFEQFVFLQVDCNNNHV